MVWGLIAIPYLGIGPKGLYYFLVQLLGINMNIYKSRPLKNEQFHQIKLLIFGIRKGMIPQLR